MRKISKEWFFLAPRLVLIIVCFLILLSKSTNCFSWFDVEGQTWAAWVQAVAALLTLYVAWRALNEWQRKERYNKLKEISLILFEVREIARSIKPLEEGIKKALTDKDEEMSRFEKALYKARLALYSCIIRYNKCLLNDVDKDVSTLEEYSPDAICEKFKPYFTKLDYIVVLCLEQHEDDGDSLKNIEDYLTGGLDAVKNLITKTVTNS